MTRINVGVDPRDLSREHLLAEHREIKRVPNAVVSGKAIISNLPLCFTLGKGHVRFFYNKLGYLRDRYILIRDECYRRGYRVTDYIGAWDDVPKHLMGAWEPSVGDVGLVLDRIRERSSVRV